MGLSWLVLSISHYFSSLYIYIYDKSKLRFKMEKQFLKLGLKKQNNKCLSMYYDMFTIKACRGTR